MTVLEDVSAFVPAPTVLVGEYLAGYGFSEHSIRVHERYYGFSKIHLDPAAGWDAQALAAARGLATLPGQRGRVRYLLQARTMPAASPYPTNPLHTVREALGLRHAAAYCLTQQACASALLAVELAGRLLAVDGDPGALALVLTGEKAFTTRPEIISQTGVMGEAVTAILVRAGGGHDRMLGYATRSVGDYNPGGATMQEASARLHEAYPETLAEVIRAALDRAGLRPEDVDWVLPHHVNQISWQRLTRLVGLDPGRVFLENLPETGHCFGADSFLNYWSLRCQGRLKPGDRYVMTAVGTGVSFGTDGLGTTYSAMVFQH